jgi:hypothetical protein
MNLDTKSFCQEHGFPVQGPPVSVQEHIRDLGFAHEPSNPGRPVFVAFTKKHGIPPGPVNHIAAAKIDFDDLGSMLPQCSAQATEERTLWSLQEQKGSFCRRGHKFYWIMDAAFF